jgi:hypothetical protein
MESGDKSPGNSDININDNMGDNSTYVDQILIEGKAVVYDFPTLLLDEILNFAWFSHRQALKSKDLSLFNLEGSFPALWLHGYS